MSPKRGGLGAGLAHRFHLLTATLVVLSSTIIGAVSYRSAVSGLNQSLHSHGETLADVTAYNAEYALFTLDDDALSALVRAVDSDPMVSYAAVHKASGEMVYSKIAADGPSTLRPLDPDQRKHEVSGEQKTWLEITAPVYSVDSDSPMGSIASKTRLLGYVRFGLGFDHGPFVEVRVFRDTRCGHLCAAP